MQQQGERQYNIPPLEYVYVSVTSEVVTFSTHENIETGEGVSTFRRRRPLPGGTSC